MKVCIICYDLKNVKPHDNLFVKAELAKFTNTMIDKVGPNILSKFPEWVRLSLPDTTLLVEVPDHITSADLMTDIIKIIESVGAEADKVYVAFIDPNTDLLWNREKKHPLLA